MAVDTTKFAIRSSSGVEQRFSAAEALVLFLPQTENIEKTAVHPQLDETIAALWSRGIFRGKRREIQLIATHGLLAYSYVMLVGLGDRPNLQAWREGAAHAARAVTKYKLTSLAVPLSPGVLEGAADAPTDADGRTAVGARTAVRFRSLRCSDRVNDAFRKSSDDPRGCAASGIIYALTEGFLLGSYRRKTYRTSAEQPSEWNLQYVEYLLDVPQKENTILKACEQAIRMAESFAEATNFARDLTNFPGNYLVPETLAEEAQKLAREHDLECIVLNEQDIAAAGMGGLMAVGQGSVHPPRMIALKYRGQSEWTDVLGLVGKGITFDTGGISLKKSEGMEEMISDMGGAAVLLGVMRALAQLKPQVNVLAVIPAAENMPSGRSYKPGDVLTTMSGKTVEVLNTDAEGRIVMADGVAYARRLGASRLIDVATLTGAVLVCLGDAATGAVTNRDEFLLELLQASRKSGENIWQLPAYDDYWEMLKSDVADVKNSTSPNRWAAAITAGLFIGTFADELPWIHLDTGGTAWLERERGVDPIGGTGAMVRTLLHFICSKR